MYSTNCSSDLRYIVTCITSQDQINLVDTIVDMGARRTCYQARLIDGKQFLFHHSICSHTNIFIVKYYILKRKRTVITLIQVRYTHI